MIEKLGEIDYPYAHCPSKTHSNAVSDFMQLDMSDRIESHRTMYTQY